jgi:hypothetical protein
MFLKFIKLQITPITIILFLILNIAYAETLVVKDGDPIKLGSRNIRLYGIDA